MFCHVAKETKEQIWIHPVKPISNEQSALNYSLIQVSSGEVVQNDSHSKKNFELI